MTLRAPAHLLPGASFRLPEVACGTPPAINRDYPLIYERNVAWQHRFLPMDAEARQRALEARYPMWDAMICPDGDADRVVHISCVTALMFEVDDLALVQQALFEDVAGDWVADHPYGPAFADVFGALEREMPPAQFARYRRSWQDWLAAVGDENRLRKARTTPDRETYLRIRRVSVGLLPYAISAEYVLGLDLTEQLAADPELGRVAVTAVEHVMYVNDLYSFRHESFRGDYFSLVPLLRHAEGLNLQQAVDEVCRLIRATDDTFTRMCARLRVRYPDPAIHAWLGGLETMCSGNLRWSMETSRYNGRGHTWNGRRSGRVTLHADHTVIEAE